MDAPTAEARGPLTDLCRRIEGGDAAAEAALVERFRRGVQAMLRKLTPDPDLAQELAQQTLWLVVQKVRAGEVLDPERLPGFVRSAARNLLIADRRKHGRLVTAGDELEAVHDLASARAAPPSAAQLDEVLRAEEARLVRTLLAELPVARDRQLLFRYYLSGEAKEAICRDLAIDIERFHRVLHRARERLRELWRRAEKHERLRRAAT